MMFGSQGKCVKAISTTSVTVSSEEIVWGTLQDQQLSCTSHRCQGKIESQASNIASVRSELDKALEENQKLKNMFNPDWLVEAMTKEVGTMTLKEHPNALQDTQYESSSNYVGKQRHPQLACGADGH